LGPVLQISVSPPVWVTLTRAASQHQRGCSPACRLRLGGSALSLALPAKAAKRVWAHTHAHLWVRLPRPAQSSDGRGEAPRRCCGFKHTPDQVTSPAMWHWLYHNVAVSTIPSCLLLCALCAPLCFHSSVSSRRAATAAERSPEAAWAFALLLQFAPAAVPSKGQNGAMFGVWCQEERESGYPGVGNWEVCWGKESLKGTDPGQLQNHAS